VAQKLVTVVRVMQLADAAAAVAVQELAQGP